MYNSKLEQIDSKENLGETLVQHLRNIFTTEQKRYVIDVILCANNRQS